MRKLLGKITVQRYGFLLPVLLIIAVGVLSLAVIKKAGGNKLNFSTKVDSLMSGKIAKHTNATDSIILDLQEQVRVLKRQLRGNERRDSVYHRMALEHDRLIDLLFRRARGQL